MSRTASQTSSVTGNAPSGHSRTLSIKTNTRNASTSIVNPLAVSDVKLFVTNLRLLHLDLRSDWPGITVQTFSLKNADQKQRIGGVEWALFQLMEMWDPEETAQKLQPFFPPLEPLQSLNLRAALYRCLNELKKNGVLGREAVLRKTMLDECKGDKFFELLAGFSTMVLKKVLAARPQKQRTVAVARSWSTADALSVQQQASLLPLAIAHKAALVNVLRRKEEKRRQYKEFEQVLDAKARTISERLVKSKATPRTQKNHIPEREAAVLKKQLKDNWIGNQRWLDTMLHGDNVQMGDAFLDRPFGDVWALVQQGRALEEAVPEAGLLENLQARLHGQQTRLQKWKQFHEELKKGDVSGSRPKTTMSRPAKEFKFDDHLELQLRSSISSDAAPPHSVPLRPEYQDILADMDAELDRVSKMRHNRSAIPHLRRNASSFGRSRSPVRRKELRSDHISKKPVQQATETYTRPVLPSRAQSKETAPVRRQVSKPVPTPLAPKATLVGQPTATADTEPSPSPPSEPDAFDDSHDEIPTQISDPPREPSPPPQHHAEALPPRSPTPPRSSTWPTEPPLLAPEDALAEQIIFSIGNATPSPIKQPPRHQPRLSLLDRTRQSMAFASIIPCITESPAPDSPALPELLLAEPTSQVTDHQVSLLERTRLSMAAMSAHPRPQKTKDARKSSSRQSLFPVNQFDTPPRARKSFVAIDEAEQEPAARTTPKEDLFSDDIDYDRVFKSRPRIAQSPIFSSAVKTTGEGGSELGGDVGSDVESLRIGGFGEGEGEGESFDEGVTGVDLGDVDADGEEEGGFTQAWDDSPSKARAKRVVL